MSALVFHRNTRSYSSWAQELTVTNETIKQVAILLAPAWRTGSCEALARAPSPPIDTEQSCARLIRMESHEIYHVSGIGQPCSQCLANVSLRLHLWCSSKRSKVGEEYWTLSSTSEEFFDISDLRSNCFDFYQTFQSRLALDELTDCVVGEEKQCQTVASCSLNKPSNLTV